MNLPAVNGEANSKIKALMTAAKQYIGLMPVQDLKKEQRYQSSIILFSDSVKYPASNEPGLYQPTGDKGKLKGIIDKLLPPEEKKLLPQEGGKPKVPVNRIVAAGETAILDATYDAIITLEAYGHAGKRAVIAMTDGIDNSSVRRVEEVIDAAKKAKIPLYVLGFGQEGEIDEVMMKKMATETEGDYFRANKEVDLKRHFEHLSVSLHHDGIDETTLKQLADETDGKYYKAKEVDELRFILETVVKGIEKSKEYEITFPSLYQRTDGSSAKVQLRLMHQDTFVGSGGTEERTQTDVGEDVVAVVRRRGLILAQMSPVIYLGLLAALGALLIIPAGMRRLTRNGAKT
jgi:hypothetical protein